MSVMAALLHAQSGQNGARQGWPCVPGRPVDPAYLEVSESTGGQLFLFQKNEVAQTSVVMNAPHTHPVTVLRLVGNLNGTRDFEFPVDSTIASVLLLVSLQCRSAILVSRPDGSELTETNSAFSVDLQAGRILRVDHPEPGQWRVRLSGRGLFVLSVLAKAETALNSVAYSINHGAAMKTPLAGVPQDVEVYLTGEVLHPRLQLVDATGERVSDIGELEHTAEGQYRTTLTPQAERFRILVTGTDSSAWPFERMYPVLFRTQPPK